jgi:hypothetical protein
VYFSDGLKMNNLFCLLSVLLPGACYRREIKIQAVRDVLLAATAMPHIRVRILSFRKTVSAI